ncbi:hypothetical protein EUGRSUZ_D01982 [Eucalyptus grandis]|uniref:Uncharacterized protein n=2 Tax=Eucalyptus grandis TaxID=71139 RepID=A0ACC3L6Z6_EUCGR|nr:hypothetical protein EUGRSUZ_D01982 [Eucalyptus grandis]
MEAFPNLAVVVDEFRELQAILGDVLEQRKLPAEVLDQATQSLNLTANIDHPRILILQVLQRLGLEPIGDDPDALVKCITANPSHRLPQDLLCILRRHRATNKQRPPIHARPIRQINSQIH